MADLGRQGSSDSNNSSSSDGGPVSSLLKDNLKVPGPDELELLARLQEANRYVLLVCLSCRSHMYFIRNILSSCWAQHFLKRYLVLRFKMCSKFNSVHWQYSNFLVRHWPVMMMSSQMDLSHLTIKPTK